MVSQGTVHMGSVCRPSPVLAVFVQRSRALGDWGFLVSFVPQTLPPCLQHPEQPSCKYLGYVMLPPKTAFFTCIFKISTDKNGGSLQAPP